MEVGCPLGTFDDRVRSFLLKRQDISLKPATRSEATSPFRKLSASGSDSGSVVVAVKGAKKQVAVILIIWAQFYGR